MLVPREGCRPWPRLVRQVTRLGAAAVWKSLGHSPWDANCRPLSTQDAEECHIGGSKIKVVSGQRSCFCVENEVALSAHLLNSSL